MSSSGCGDSHIRKGLSKVTSEDANAPVIISKALRRLWRAPLKILYWEAIELLASASCFLIMSFNSVRRFSISLSNFDD